MAAVFPTRTVTFLFTDIEGSTRLWQTDRVAMGAALSDHDALLVKVIESNGGSLFKHTGDGVCAVFESAAMAVDAAVDAQQQLQLPVRMGVHTGDAQERDGDYFGPTLNRCARLMDAGHGGQVLLSATTNELVDHVEVTDLGEFQLKDLAVPEQIYQVGTASFPLLRVQDRRVSLPAMFTSLVGRDELVAEVVDLVAKERLVTLVGMGGVGKTRVAVAAAEQAASGFDRTVFVDLALAGDEADVLPTLGRALELTTPSWQAMSIALADRRVLLVLDNCEHVVDAVADLAFEILAGSPGAVILATSREGLAVDGERLVAVPGLSSRDADSDAVALFVDRARSGDPDFVLDDVTGAQSSELCRQLDGIPLALELAAARLGQMTIHELLERLDDRFGLLTGGRRRRSRDRHRTLRETVDWSYDLLDAEEKYVFARISVFAGTFDLGSASAVLDGRDQIELLDQLGALVDKSMLTITRLDGTVRYRFLETVRTYAEEKLDESGETHQTLALLTDHLGTVVRRAVDDLFSGQSDGAARIRIEIPNTRRALDFAIEQRDVGAAVALIAPLAEVCGAIDWSIDGWADEILELSESRGHPGEPALLVLQATDLWLGGEFRSLPEQCRRVLHAAQIEAGASEPGAWWVHRSTAMFARMSGAEDLAVREGARALQATENVDPAIRLFTRLSVDAYLLNLTTWQETVEGAELDHGRTHSSPILRAMSFLWLAFHAYREGSFEDMLDAAREATEYGVEGSSTWFGSLQMQATALLRLGQLERALALADVDLEYAHHYGDRSAMFIPIGTYAVALKELDEPDVAAIVRGWLPRRLTIMLAHEIVGLDRWLNQELAPGDLRDLKARGRAMSPTELQTLGRQVAASHFHGG